MGVTYSSLKQIFKTTFYVIQVCFLFWNNEGNLYNKNHHSFLMLFFLIMLIVFFFWKITPSFSVWNHWKNNLFFTILVMFWIINKIYFSFLVYKSNSEIIFLNFFPIIFFWWVIYYFSLVFTYKRFLLFFHNVFLFVHDLMRLLQRIEFIYYRFYWWDLLLLFCFLSNQEYLYMIHLD